VRDFRFWKGKGKGGGSGEDFIFKGVGRRRGGFSLNQKISFTESKEKFQFKMEKGTFYTGKGLGDFSA
jgi:hypothetical protein